MWMTIAVVSANVLVVALAFAGGLWAAEPPTGGAGDNKVAEITLGEPQRIGGIGDVWEAAWADDDNLYLVSDDGHGLDSPVAGNLVCNRLSGDLLKLKEKGNRKTINPMQEYGGAASPGYPKDSTAPRDGCNWKGNGITCVDGVLYIWVSRHNYSGSNYPDAAKRQTACNSSLIKSSDYGQTWTRTAKENYEQPMFPGRRFGAPFFVQYGKNYGNGAHGSERFVYVVSNNGFWDNGDDMILGRVPRAKIAELDADDWQFYKGGDGAADASWGKLDEAVPIIRDSGRCSMTGVQYVAPLKKYLMTRWYYTNGPGHVDPKDTTWIFCEAPAPWGPWREIGKHRFERLGFYNPCIVSKFIRDDGENLNLAIFTAGDFKAKTHYCLTLLPCRIRMPGPANPAP